MSGHDAICEELSWDSKFFGLSIARAVPSQLDDRTRVAMLDWCERRRVDCLYFLCPLEQTATQRQLFDSGFQLVGVKVTLARPAGTGSGDVRGHVREATADDIPRLRQIAFSAHRDTRFHADGHFDPARCDELYSTWVENSVHGYATCVLVAERDGVAVGYITLHIDGDDVPPARRAARIGLFAVDERWRNQGIGHDLLRRAAQLLDGRDAWQTSVVTAGKNVAAMKLYKSEGFHTTDVSLWYHRWFRGDIR